MKRIKYLIFMLGLMPHVATSKTWKDRGGLIKHEKIRNENWLSSHEDDHKKAIEQVLSTIEASKRGQILIARARLKARKDNKSLFDVIKVGDVSITDTTLIRRFSPSSPSEITYTTKSTVYIDRSLSMKNAVLDMTHELTHFVFKKPFNPYEGSFSLSKFMYDTIQAKGGEVDAFLTECEVALDVFGKSMLSGQCQAVLNGDEFSRRKSINEFYKLGLHYNNFLSKAESFVLDTSRFPVSSDNATLISSAWGTPYPLSVIEEYESIMGKVCSNDKKRLTYFDENKGRFPASAPSRISKMINDYQRRCKNFTE